MSGRGRYRARVAARGLRRRGRGLWAARPSNPEELFDDLVQICGLEPSALLLEIGCGTGQATRPLARRGFRIICVELGENLAAVARRTTASFPTVRIVNDAFEAWEPDDGPFDLLYVATAWKWIDPAVRYAKAAEVLKPSGWLAVFSSSHAFPPDADPFFTEIQEVYDSIGETAEQWPPPLPDDVPGLVAEIVASSLFADVTERRYVWEQRYTAEEYIALLETFSGHISMGHKRERLYSEIRRRLAERPEGSVRRHWVTVLDIARLRAPAVAACG